MHRNLASLFLVALSLSALGFVSCIPFPQEEDPEEALGQFSGVCLRADECDPTKPDGCFETNDSFCIAYDESGDPYDAFGYNREDIDRDFYRRNRWSLPDSRTCLQYYDTACASCVDWDFDSCSTTQSRDFIESDTRTIAEMAAEDRLDDAIRNDVRDLVGADAISERDPKSKETKVRTCLDVYQSECTAIFNDNCPEVALESCADIRYVSEEELLENPSEEGVVFADMRCRSWLELQCNSQCRDRYTQDLTVEFCEDPQDSATEDGKVFKACVDTVDTHCSVQRRQLCQDAYPTSLELCGDLDTNVSAFCRDSLETFCGRDLPGLCAQEYPFNLLTCSDLSDVPPVCLEAGQNVCDNIIANECPQRSVTNCFNPTLAPAACIPSLTETCENWEDLCVSETDLTFAVCSDYNLLSGALQQLPSECSNWALTQCTDTFTAWEEARVAAEELCFGKVVYIPPQTEEPTTEELADPAHNIDTNRLGQEYTKERGRFDCLNPELGQWSDEQADWNRNGARVRSCEEYAFKRYYTVASFVTAIEPFKEDARLVYDLAFAPDPADIIVNPPSNTPSLDQLNIAHQALQDLPNNEPFEFLSSPRGQEMDRNRFGYGGFDTAWFRRKSQFVLISNPQYAELRAELRDHIPCEQRTVLDNGDVICTDNRNFIESVIVDRNNQIIDKLESDSFNVYFDYINAHGAGSGWEEIQRRVEHFENQGISDEELTFWYNERQRYFGLLLQWAEANKPCPPTTIPGSNIPVNDFLCEAQRTNQRAVLQQEIWKSLSRANAAGCFNTAQFPNGDPAPTKCDWALEDFVNILYNRWGNLIPAATELCYTYAPVDFAALQSGYDKLQLNGSRVEEVSVGNPTTNARDFRTYINDEITTTFLEPRWFAQLANELAPAERPIWGQHWGDGNGFGNPKYFWAGYEYGAGWEVIPPLRETIEINGNDTEILNTCGSNATAYAFFNAGVTMFRRESSLVDTSLEANAAGGVLEGRLKLFGFNVWSPTQEEDQEESPDADVDYRYNYVIDESTVPVDERVAYTIKVFSIIGIDVFVRVGASAQVGIDFKGEISYGVDFAQCSTRGTAAEMDVATEIEVTPFAQADGFVEAGFSFIGIEVGVGGRLIVVDARLPSTMNMTLGGGLFLGAAEGSFRVEADVNLEYTLLRGEVYAFAEYWFDDWRKTLYRFGGYDDTINLFEREFEWEFGQAFDFCETDNIDCESLARVRPGGDVAVREDE